MIEQTEFVKPPRIMKIIIIHLCLLLVSLAYIFIWYLIRYSGKDGFLSEKDPGFLVPANIILFALATFLKIIHALAENVTLKKICKFWYIAAIIYVIVLAFSLPMAMGL